MGKAVYLRSQQIGTGTQENPAGDIIMDYRYQYDRAGNITQRSTEQGTWQYGYDNLDRLTQAVPPETLQRSESNPSGLPVEGYTYDAVHNRTTSQHQPGTWNYNQNHQLLSFGTEDSKTTYTYNVLGHTEQEITTQNNVTTQQRNYLYNAAERLTEVKENNQTIARYQYDPFGRRISKTVNGETIWFQYSDEGLITEYKNQTLTKLYGWQPQGLWGSEPLWQAAVSGAQKTTHYYHADNLGTSQRLTDKDGNQTWAMQSEAFGKATIPATATAENNLRFPGQYYDEETALHYNYFRDYSPVIGRYIEADPIGLEGGINLHEYAGSNPLIYTDPSGENPVLVGLGILAKALQKCAKDKKCRCNAIYAAYKAACSVPGCKNEKIDCCIDPDCKYLKFKTLMARACYTLRGFYVSQGCDAVFPTRRDHPDARNQALQKYINCQEALAKCLRCSGGR